MAVMLGFCSPTQYFGRLPVDFLLFGSLDASMGYDHVGYGRINSIYMKTKHIHLGAIFLHVLHGNWVVLLDFGTMCPFYCVFQLYQANHGRYPCRMCTQRLLIHMEEKCSPTNHIPGLLAWFLAKNAIFCQFAAILTVFHPWWYHPGHYLQ